MASLRIGILGAARIAPRAIVKPASANPEVEVLAVAARDPQRAAAFANRHGILRVHPDYDTLLGDPDIDAIYNPQPNGLHGRWTIAALDAGKHVLCEKPFTANAEEAEAVGAAAARSGLVVMEAFHYRYHPLMARVLEIVATLGTLREVAARVIAVLPNRGDVRYRLDLAGGATMDVGCYALHQVRTVVGAEPLVQRAQAQTLTPGIDRSMHAELVFPDGPTATMECALLSAKAPVAELRVTGDRGTTRAHFLTRPQIAWITTRTEGSTRRERVPGRATFCYQLEAFCDATLRGKAVLTPPSDAIANMRAIDSVYEAAGLAVREPTR